ncbi:MAG: hypothetical protein C5B50_05020 [Verrucomicrobia bacterium]|nr:MAG: hypothetical protein C5B50_05020 [Verrucomicrobiota bacterium]
MEKEAKNERVLLTMIAFLSALAFGGMLATAQAVQISQTEIGFRFSVWTVVAFLVGFNALFVYLELIFICREKASLRVRRVGLLVLVLITLGALLYPLRIVGVSKQAQKYAGGATALCVIGTGLALVRRFVRAAEREELQQETQEHEAASHGANPASELPSN